MINLMGIFTNLIANLAVFLNGILLQIPMADTFRSEGKIYVLMGVVLVILIGFFAYLIRIERKIKKLEDDFKNK